MANFSIDHQILIIKEQGEWNFPTAMAAQKEAARLVQENQLTGILVDLREADISFSVLENYQGTSSHADLFPLGTKHAVVVRKDKNLHEQGQFFENVATNRGVKAGVFLDIQEARKWLLSDIPSSG